LTKLLPCILPEKYINIIVLEMVSLLSPGNRHCANCIGTLSFSMRKARQIRLLCARQLLAPSRSGSDFRDTPQRCSSSSCDCEFSSIYVLEYATGRHTGMSGQCSMRILHLLTIGTTTLCDPWDSSPPTLEITGTKCILYLLFTNKVA